jgi:phage major head subunit gpT-like protein
VNPTINPNVLTMGPAIENPAAYVNAQIRFRAAFFDALESAKEDDLMQLADTVMSDTAAEQHIFMGDVPGFKEWVGDREMGSIAAHKISLVNRNWASGVPVHRNQVEDDQLGLVMRRISGLAPKAKRHKGKLIAEILLNGFAGNANYGKLSDGVGAGTAVGDGTCYDGAFFFSTTHSLEGGPNQSNLLANTALSDKALEDAITLMRNFTTYDGQDPLDVQPTHLLVGPALEWMAKRLLQQELRVRMPGDVAATSATGADTNIHKNSLQVIVSPRIRSYAPNGGADYSKAWFLLALNEPVKPILFQDREAISTAALVGWDSPEMFKKGLLQFGTQARYAAAFYDWRTAVGSQGA